MSPNPVRVLIADRQPLFLEAVARAVRQHSGLELVGEVADGRAALEAIEREAPDVAVVGIDLPRLDGLRVLNAVVRDGLRTRVLLLAATSEAPRAHAAIRAGAAGWLSRVAEAGELCAAIVTVAHGHVATTPDAMAAIASEIRRGGSPTPVLDRRERDVLVLLARGMRDQEIGRELHLSPTTVKAIVVRLHKRLGVANRLAAVAEAFRLGLIE